MSRAADFLPRQVTRTHTAARYSIATLLAGVMMLGTSGTALAQGTRVGDTQFPKPATGGETRRFQAVSYDGANDAYLVVWGIFQLGARYVSADGTPLGGPTALNTDGTARSAGAVRVACGANINACMVAWIEESPTRVVGRLVRYSGGDVQFLTDRFVVSDTGGAKLNSAAPTIAYSAANSEFLVAWTETNTNVYAQRMSPAGAQLGERITIAETGAWEGLPSATYNSAQNEFFVAYYSETTHDRVAGTRVQAGTGVVLGDMILYAGPFEKYPEVVYNSVSNEYLAISWSTNFTLHGRRLDGNGQPISDVLSLGIGGGDGIGVSFSPVANTYFAVYLHVASNEIFGTVVTPEGAVVNQLQVTASGTALATHPQAAGSTVSPTWLTVASENFRRVMSQLVQNGGAPPPPPPPPPGPVPCTFTINPSTISIGGNAADGTLFVTASRSDCAWEAAGNGFITFQNGTGRVGSGSVPFNIAANPLSTPRAGETTVAGQTFHVTQGPACSFDVSPTNISVGAGASDGAVILSTPGGCGWTAASHSAFMTFTGSKSGAGSASLPFAIAANPSTIARTGSATIAGHTMTINQGGAPFNAAARARENARADFDGNGESDLVLQNVNTGSLGAWLFADVAVAATPSLSHGIVDFTNWRIMGTSDFNGDGQPDIVLQHLAEGWIFVWYMNGTTRAGGAYTSFHKLVDVRWRIAAVGDMNQDGHPDIVWQHPDGWLALWLMNGVSVVASVPLVPGSVQDVQWQIAAMGDFNGDGKNDLLWRHMGRGDLGVWFMDGFTRIGFSPLQPGVVANQAWQIAAVIDANNDNTPDIVWQNATEGTTVLWLMIGTERIAAPNLPNLPAGWIIAGAK